MPQAREVTCPSEECKHVRTIKAAPGVRLSCPKCGTKTRAPEITEAVDSKPTAAPTQPKSTKVDGIEIVHVDEVKFPRNAHVKKAKDSLPPAAPIPPTSGNEGGELGGAGTPPPPSNKPTIPPPPPNQERFQHAGRRGGSNFYKQRREAKRDSRRAS